MKLAFGHIRVVLFKTCYKSVTPLLPPLRHASNLPGKLVMTSRVDSSLVAEAQGRSSRAEQELTGYVFSVAVLYTLQFSFCSLTPSGMFEN